MPKKEMDLTLLKQLVNSLEEATNKLEKTYNENNYDDFYKAKRIIPLLQKQILGVIG